MPSLRKLTILAVPSLAVFSHLAFAQPAPVASISGRVLSEDGRPLQGTVTVTFATPRGYPAPPRRVRTGENGTFTFSRLSPGSYALCAQIAPSEEAPPNSPYLDTCVWGSGEAPIQVEEGQQVTNVVFTAPKGAWLKVHVADPERVLSRKPAAADMQFFLRGPDGLVRDARLVSDDEGGRVYQAIVPLKTAIDVKVAHATGEVFDHTGKRLPESEGLRVKAETAAELSPLSFTVRRK